MKLTRMRARLTTADREPLDLDLTGLRTHVAELHPSLRNRRANADLATAHAHQHTRFHQASHSHLAGRITIRVAGLPMQYDEGWLTGQGAMTPGQVKARFMNSRKAGWKCEDCSWPWPLPGDPSEGAKCDSCGGGLVRS